MNERIYYSQEAEQQARRQQILIAILVASFGLTVGVVTALLFAPKSGDKVRRDLASTIGDTADASEDALKRMEREFADLRKAVENRITS